MSRNTDVSYGDVIDRKKAVEELKKTRSRSRAKSKPDPSVAQPTQTPEPTSPKVSNPLLQAAVEEAFTLPYEPPSYHFGPNDDPFAEIAQRELCRRKLLPFIQRFRPKYMAGWVHEDICRRIERFVRQVEQGLSPRLLLMMPPRSGKSEISSRHTPAWILGQHPDWEIIAGSHTSSLSLSFSRYLRDVMRDPAYTAVFPDAVLDPSSQSVENWNLTKGGGYLAAGVGTGITGRGCLAPYTLVDTNRGKIRIIDLKVGDSVYGYNHKQQKVVATRVKAVQVTERSKQLLDFGDVRLTTDHRIYNAARGFYTRAGESPNLLGLRRQEGSSRCNVQGVLFQSADRGDHNAQMQLLWEELSAQRGRAPEVARSARRGSESVLQSPLLRHVQDQQPSGLQQGEGRVSTLQKAGYGGGSFEVLQQGLLQRVQGFETADGCVQWRVSDAQSAGVGAGQEVLALRHTPRPVRGASHQSRRDGQPDFKSGTAVRCVPPQISSVHGACAADIAGLFEPFDFVVDIQTETSNFFTEGLLVHNCHVLLLDDLVKDMEAADSLTIRDNTWEWYLSTAYTRLAPGGGVLGLMCMTGDTPVLMADGSERRLDSMRAGDEIATYRNGSLSTSLVAAMKSSGRDSVFKITTTSGKIVRANQRHPFLTITPEGELVWTRVKSLTTAHKIAVKKGNGESGEESLALWKAVSSLPSVEACAPRTITRKSGQTGVAPSVTATMLGEMLDSSTATASPGRTMTICMPSRKAVALSVVSTLRQALLRGIGKISSLWTTATTLEKSEDCFAMTATQESDILELSRWHVPLRNTSDFIAEQIVSIEPDGEEEVFDLQVDRTENFIANGVVSHNTWWHDDDWAGRIQQAMLSGDGDQFEIIKYPAVNDYGDEYILPDDSIAQFPPTTPAPEGARLTRLHNTAIHPARYTTEMMLKIKRNLIAGGQKRVWDALYQQNPVPDEGNYFSKDMFRYYGAKPDRRDLYVYQAWDFAISEGKDSDYTVGTCIGVDHRDNVYYLDQRRFRIQDGGFIIDQILDFAQEYDADCLGFEDGQIWKAIEFQFQKRCEERKQYPNHELLKPLTDKMVRANPLRGRMQLGKVFFDKNAAYFTELLKEMLHFPAGKHDDQIDSLAWAIRLTLSRAAPRESRPQPKLPSWKDKLKGYGGKGASHMCA